MLASVISSVFVVPSTVSLTGLSVNLNSFPARVCPPEVSVKTLNAWSVAVAVSF